MNKNRQLVEQTIQLRMKQNDPVREFAVRNKASPLNKWSDFIPYTEEAIKKFYHLPIDGFKLKFKFTTLTISGRHKNK